MAVPNCEFFEFFPCTGANMCERTATLASRRPVLTERTPHLLRRGLLDYIVIDVVS
jgi:hypothetical protein